MIAVALIYQRWYSMHHSDLVDVFDMLVLLLALGVCVAGGWQAGARTRRLMRSGR